MRNMQLIMLRSGLNWRINRCDPRRRSIRQCDGPRENRWRVRGRKVCTKPYSENTKRPQRAPATLKSESLLPNAEAAESILEEAPKSHAFLGAGFRHEATTK